MKVFHHCSFSFILNKFNHHYPILIHNEYWGDLSWMFLDSKALQKISRELPWLLIGINACNPIHHRILINLATCPYSSLFLLIHVSSYEFISFGFTFEIFCVYIIFHFCLGLRLWWCNLLYFYCLNDNFTPITIASSWVIVLAFRN
jgi:hypothetical protein